MPPRFNKSYRIVSYRSVRCKALLSSLTYQPLHLYHCHIPTCLAVRRVFDTKSHPFDLCLVRVKLRSSICAKVRRIFKFQSQSTIVVFLIHLIIKNYVTFLILRNFKIRLTITQIAPDLYSARS